MPHSQVVLLSRVAECTSSPSYLGGWGRRPAYAQEFQASLDNIARSLSQKHNTKLNFVHAMLPKSKLSKSVLQNSTATMMWGYICQRPPKREGGTDDRLTERYPVKLAGWTFQVQRKRWLFMPKSNWYMFFPSVAFLVWCSHIKYCTLEVLFSSRNMTQGRNRLA